MTDFTSQAIPLAALLLGAFLMWFLMASRIKSNSVAAAAAATTALQVEVAQATEKVRSATNELELAKEDARQKSELLATVQARLDQLKDEQARMAERLLRLPLVEAELRATEEQLKSNLDETRRLSSSEAQKAQSIESLQERFEALKVTHNSLEQQHRDVSTQLRDSLQRRATLEEQVVRIPDLDARLHDASRQLSECNSSLQASNDRRIALEEQVTRLPALEFKLLDATKQLSDLNVQLREAVERRVALEEQAARLPGLESQLKDSVSQFGETNAQLTDLRESSARDNGKLKAELAAERTAAMRVLDELMVAKTSLSQAEAQLNELTEQLTQLRTQAEAEQKNSAEKLELLLQAKAALSDQFKTLANDILEEKSKRFAERNREGVSLLLEPLKTKLTEFQGKVEEVYVNEGKDRSALSAQVNRLVELNQALSQDAKNLTLALKGSAKTQGNWGELILERVLRPRGCARGMNITSRTVRCARMGLVGRPTSSLIYQKNARLWLTLRFLWLRTSGTFLRNRMANGRWRLSSIWIQFGGTSKVCQINATIPCMG
jgi:DNA recombination protein RmuC